MPYWIWDIYCYNFEFGSDIGSMKVDKDVDGTPIIELHSDFRKALDIETKNPSIQEYIDLICKN